MPLQKEYYSDKLYPLQDAVLTVIAACDTEFYLTGGTVLSRWYLQHRFSDDLDFFVNAAVNFPDQADRALGAIEHAGLGMRIDKRGEDFARIRCSAHGAELRVDFVNDVPYRSGTTHSVDQFPRVDGWWNILSNKITAVGRREPKDAVDILFLCRTYEFEWEQVFHEAMQKATFIDPLDISVILSEFPKEFFSRVQWIADFSFDDGYSDLQTIAKDILQKKTNSLAGTR